VQHVNFDVQLLGNCDDVVVELARRAGWDFKHEMVDDKAKLSVNEVEDASHIWTVSKAGAAPRTTAENGSLPSNSGAGAAASVPSGFQIALGIFAKPA
jgi:hypothetical protein